MEASVKNTQVAPFPSDLATIVDRLTYRPGWRCDLRMLDRGQGSEGLTFVVLTDVVDTYDPDEKMHVTHYFPVPPAAFNRQSWLRWVLDRFIEIETHEVCEFMQVDGIRPFAPNHGPGWDPYVVRELNRPDDAEVDFRGVRDEGSQGQRCDRPPAGWHCSRLAGHEGPCAAVEDGT